MDVCFFCKIENGSALECDDTGEIGKLVLLEKDEVSEVGKVFRSGRTYLPIVEGLCARSGTVFHFRKAIKIVRDISSEIGKAIGNLRGLPSKKGKAMGNVQITNSLHRRAILKNPRWLF